MASTDLLDFAMQMEKDGRPFYRQCAEKTSDKGIAGIMNRLAKAEVVHYNVLQQIKEDAAPEAYDSAKVAGDIQNLFAEMLESGAVFGGEESELELYRKAPDMERKSRDFYLREAANVESEAGRHLFERIAGEEKQHIDYIGSIIEFVKRAEPGNWLENAEWYHHEEY